jgi:hypothetical protein
MTMDLDALFAFYRDEFLPSYSDLVGYIADKPQNILFVLEHVFSHISQTFNPDISSETKEENIKKAYGHLQRATLDGYKLLWVEIYKKLVKIENDESLRKFGLKISGSVFLVRLQELRELAREARKKEMMFMGVDPIASINLYKRVVTAGYELDGGIDENKTIETKEYVQSLKRSFSVREFILAIVVAVSTGLISGYLLSFI